MRAALLVCLLAGALNAGDELVQYTPVTWLASRVSMDESTAEITQRFAKPPSDRRNGINEVVAFAEPPKGVMPEAVSLVAQDGCEALAAWSFHYKEGKMQTAVLNLAAPVPVNSLGGRRKPPVLVKTAGGSMTMAAWPLSGDRVLVALGVDGQGAVRQWLLARRSMLSILYPDVASALPDHAGER